MAFPDFEHKLAHIELSPLVVAVEVEQDGTWFRGRATSFVQDSSGWLISVAPERDAGKAGARGGWFPPEQVRAGQHPVWTTHSGQTWLTWQPQPLPEALACLRGAATNMHERPTQFG